MHVSIRKNFGGMRIFLSGSQELEWTQTYDPYCKSSLSVINSYCFIFLLRLSIQHERPWLSPVLEKDQSQQSYTTSDRSPVYYELLDPGGKNVIVLYDISLKKEH